MSRRVVFCDVDGPLLPSGMLLVDADAKEKCLLSPICVAVLLDLLAEADALLVMNTTRNVEPADLRAALRRAGIPDDVFHPDWMTEYPRFPREEAVRRWLSGNRVAAWVALDDEVFTVDGRLIPVDYDGGLTPAHRDAALKSFGLKPSLILPKARALVLA